MGFKKIPDQQKEQIKIGQKYKWKIMSDRNSLWEVADITGSFIALKKVSDGALVESREDLFVQEFELVESMKIVNSNDFPLLLVFKIITHLTKVSFEHGSNFRAQLSCLELTESRGWKLINYVGTLPEDPLNDARLNQTSDLDDTLISVRMPDRTKAIALALLWGLLKDYFKQYEERLISIGKLGEILDLSYEEVSELLKVYQIPKDIGVDSLAELAEDIKNAT